MELMKKRKIKRIIIFVFAFIFLGGFVSANHDARNSCHDSYKTGDVDNDGQINIVDAIRILNWLFLSGESPYCFERADLNLDDSVDLSDAVFLLNWLFQGGQPPQELGGDGVNDLKLGWVYVIEDIEAAEQEIANGQIPERTVKLPNTLSVLDLSGESDMKECYVVVSEIGRNGRIVSEETMLVTDWDSARGTDDQFIGTGNDISKEPFSFMIGPPYLWDGRTYEVAVTCIDTLDQEDSIRIKINTIFADQDNGNNEPLCASPSLCCRSRSSGNFYCAYPEIDPNGNDIPDTAECISPTNEQDDEVDYANCNNQPLADENNDRQGKVKLLTAQPSPSPAGPCKVKSMTILRKSSDIVPDGFKVPPYLSEQKFGDADFGHQEGKTTIQTNKGVEKDVWLVQYLFIVKAEVEGDPAKCVEGQFIQRKGTVLYSSGQEGVLTTDTPGFLYSKKDIVRDVKHADRYSEFPSVNRLNAVKRFITLAEVNDNAGCPISEEDTAKWCADDYKEERGGPGKDRELWDYHLKKHDGAHSLILWNDAPGSYFDPTFSFVDKKSELRFIAIVEDENPPGEHRYICFLTGLIFENLGQRATATQKFQVTEPSCSCVKQEWTILETGNEGWKDKGDPKEC